MIETRGLTRHCGKTKAVEDLDLRVEPGEILGLLGPNGAGKTTTVKILTCMIKPTSGSASVAGFDVVTMVANLRGIDGEGADRKINEFPDLFDVLDARDRRLVGHSKGMRQKVLITSALLGNPEVLFLDEPLSGIDANAALVVKQLLRELAAKGRTILFCSHILEVVERVCTRIVVVNDGRKIIEGDPGRIAAEAGAKSLEEAFARLTGVRDAGDVTRDLLRALEGSVPTPPRVRREVCGTPRRGARGGLRTVAGAHARDAEDGLPIRLGHADGVVRGGRRGLQAVDGGTLVWLFRPLRAWRGPGAPGSLSVRRVVVEHGRTRSGDGHSHRVSIRRHFTDRLRCSRPSTHRQRARLFSSSSRTSSSAREASAPSSRDPRGYSSWSGTASWPACCSP